MEKAHIPILKIRDENGNFIPINAIRGDKGKSAYEQAKDGGYTGTEEAFIALLNGLTATVDAQHYANLNNPHGVTCSQIGAATSGHTHTPESIGAAPSNHEHTASDITSGTLSSDRLPNVPVSKGGTGISASSTTDLTRQLLKTQIVNITSTDDGQSYSGTLEGVTELYKGLEITVVPNKINKASATLNINGLGDNPIFLKKQGTSRTWKYIPEGVFGTTPIKLICVYADTSTWAWLADIQEENASKKTLLWEGEESAGTVTLSSSEWDFLIVVSENSSCVVPQVTGSCGYLPYFNIDDQYVAWRKVTIVSNTEVSFSKNYGFTSDESDLSISGANQVLKIYGVKL